MFITYLRDHLHKFTNLIPLRSQGVSSSKHLSDLKKSSFSSGLLDSRAKFFLLYHAVIYLRIQRKKKRKRTLRNIAQKQNVLNNEGTGKIWWLLFASKTSPPPLKHWGISVYFFTILCTWWLSQLVQIRTEPTFLRLVGVMQEMESEEEKRGSAELQRISSCTFILLTRYWLRPKGKKQAHCQGGRDLTTETQESGPQRGKRGSQSKETWAVACAHLPNNAPSVQVVWLLSVHLGAFWSWSHCQLAGLPTVPQRFCYSWRLFSSAFCILTAPGHFCSSGSQMLHFVPFNLTWDP